MSRLEEKLPTWWSPISAMNALQNAGVVSDNALTLADVDEADVDRALAFLEREVNF